MDSAFRAFLETPDPGAKPQVKRRRGYNSFGWTICLLLLTGGVMASWITSFYVFSHPENPGCYHFLKKLNRIEPPKRFELTAAPPGKFFTAKELYDSYLTMSDDELDAKNHEFLRNYLRNYTGTKTPVRYIWGRFITTGVYNLGRFDMFPTGMVAVADSKDCPQVQIEYIYPMAFANVPRARQMLAADPEINLEKSFSLAAIVHVGKVADGRMLFTIMPIDYGPYAYKQGISSTFRLDPPSSLNLEAGLPVVNADEMEDAVKTFALYRKNKGLLAKGNMLTLPPAPAGTATSQTTDFYAAGDIPPEAYQPYVKPVIATPPAPAPAAESAVAAADSAPPPVMPPAEELPPVTAQTSAVAQTMAQAAPESPPAASAPASLPAEAAVSPPTPAAPITSLPAAAKTSPPLPRPVSVVSTAQAAPALPRAPAAAKPEQIVGKSSVAALPSPAPAVRPIARIQPSQTTQSAQSSATAAAFLAATRSPTPQPKISTYVNTQRALPYSVPAPVEYAEAVPAESSASGVKLDPFLGTQSPQAQPPQAQQPSIAPARSATWQTYRAGLMPRGKLISLSEAPQLADLGIGSERLYVNGRFIVTASSEGRAVLRPVDGAVSGNSVRMVVEYPGGAPVPMEGTQVARGAYRPFQIIDVRRGDDGQVNIYAREVTVPMSQPSSYPPGAYRMAQRGNGID